MASGWGKRRVALVASLTVATLCASAATAALWSNGSAASHVRTPAGDAGVRLVVLGDSVPAGTGCDCRPFGDRLAADLRRRMSTRVSLRSFAQDGLTSAGLQDEVEHDRRTIAALRRATTVTVTIGANDFDASQADSGCDGSGTSCFDADLDALTTHLQSLLGEIRGLSGSGARILVTGYWSVFLDGDVAAQRGSTYTATSDALTERVNAVIAAAAAQRGATYVDLFTAFRGSGDNDDSSLLASDGDHPSDAGHALIETLLERALLAS